MLFTKKENITLHESNLTDEAIEVIEKHLNIIDNKNITNKDLDLAVVNIQKEMLEMRNNFQKEMAEMRNEFNLKLKDLELKITKVEEKISKTEARLTWRIFAMLITVLSPFYYQLISQLVKH